MKISTYPLYEVKLYLGSVEWDGISFSKADLMSYIGEFQDGYKGDTIPVRITDTTFISGIDYDENGWEVAAISYPKTNHSHDQTLEFMLALGKYLLRVFFQSRICVLDCQPNLTDNVYMLESLENPVDSSG